MKPAKSSPSANCAPAHQPAQAALERAEPGGLVGWHQRQHPIVRWPTRACAADDISAIGLTGQMHGLVLLDAGGAVLRPSILWNDQRTQAQCDLHDRGYRRRSACLN